MDGIIVVNKPKGITSFDVIRKLRKILKEKKIGHTGTLDPLAQGVLVVCVGKATKLVQDIEAYEKRYVAGFELGYRTDTYDSEGEIIQKGIKDSIDEANFREILKKYVGDIEQIPPMYSAIKVNGQKLYELARKGIEIERKARKIKISDIKLLEFDGKKGKILCDVSKGTYIRTLIDDIGNDSETLATMISLVREKVGNCTLQDSYSLEEIEEKYQNKDMDFILEVEKFFNFEKFDIDIEKNFTLFKNGNTLVVNKKDGFYSIYYKNQFIGLGKVEKNRLKGYKYF